MSTFANSENKDEMPGSTLFVKVKKVLRQKNTIFLFLIITWHP